MEGRIAGKKKRRPCSRLVVIDLSGKAVPLARFVATSVRTAVPLVSVPLVAATFRRSTFYLNANRRPNWPGILKLFLLRKSNKIKVVTVML
jgi:hypothetical protein